MTINKDLNGTELTLALEGRLDTSTAPDLEAAINSNLEGVTKLVLDFYRVEYISSAGLRVLLSARKTMASKGEMLIRNVSDEVMEIFDITGFVDILTIE